MMSPNLTEWVLSSIVQSEAALMGFSLAAIGIIAVFLYRDGEFSKHMDRSFSNYFPTFRICIISSFIVGGVTLCAGLIGLLLSEIVPDIYRIIFSVICSILLVASVILSMLSGIIILKSIKAKVRGAKQMKIDELLSYDRYDYDRIHQFVATKGIQNVTPDDMDKIISKYGKDVLGIVDFFNIYSIVSSNYTNKIMKRWTIAIGVMTLIMTITTIINLFPAKG